MMKKLLVLGLIISACTSLQAQKIEKVLFVGNSYTGFHNLANLTSEVAKLHGDTFEATDRSPGGFTFKNHTAAPDFFLQLREGNFDAVVLQEQSQLPSFPMSQVETECFPYAKQIVDSIRAINPKTKIAFYMTWGRQNGDAQNCPNWPPVCTFGGMNGLLRERYISMAQQNSCRVAPVGVVWRDLRDSTSINLYEPDGSHPSPEGSLTAAMVIYATLFDKQLKNNFSLMPYSAQTIAQIANTANFITQDSAALWNYEYQLNIDHIKHTWKSQGTAQKITPIQNLVNITAKPNEIWSIYTVNGVKLNDNLVVNRENHLEINTQNLTPNLYYLISNQNGIKPILFEN
jgi:hypothetical protein